MMKKLILMVGLPRSGKTTRARELGVPIVNPDSIREVLHGTAFRPEAEPLVWALAKTMVRALFAAGHDSVVVDACNNTVKRRKEWKSYDGEWARTYMYENTPVEVCRQRAAASEAGTALLPVIDRMASQHEPVTEEERDGEEAVLPQHGLPSLEQLEEILNSGQEPGIEILPNGEVRAKGEVKSPDPGPLKKMHY